jgi:hypothetical protein
MSVDAIAAHPVFWACVAAAFLWNVGYAIWRIRRIRRSGRSVFALAPEGALFTERWASGGSERSLWTRWGAARNCLFVALTPERLLIRPQFPFNLFAGDFDLEHELPLKEVALLEARGRAVLLELPGRRFTLHLRKSEAFLELWERLRGV